ncbi:hypothetical protein HYW40_01415 [Candidatus Curtissbacteria bacterium]|nr:hypothetical protein [Candidatus Curtissbacteria bacterium]
MAQATVGSNPTLSAMNKSKSLDDLKSALEIIDGNIDLFHQGKISTYRVIATQLHILFCGNGALIPRIFKESALHPLKGPRPELFAQGLIFSSPALISFDGKGNSKVLKLFDENKKPISIEKWLNQPLFNEKVTIGKLIASVRNKEGAHSDRNYNATLIFTKSIKLVDEDIHVKYIVAIGEYVSRSLHSILHHFKIN